MAIVENDFRGWKGGSLPYQRVARYGLQKITLRRLNQIRKAKRVPPTCYRPNTFLLADLDVWLAGAVSDVIRMPPTKILLRVSKTDQLDCAGFACLAGFFIVEQHQYSINSQFFGCLV